MLLDDNFPDENCIYPINHKEIAARKDTPLFRYLIRRGYSEHLLQETIAVQLRKTGQYFAFAFLRIVLYYLFFLDFACCVSCILLGAVSFCIFCLFNVVCHSNNLNINLNFTCR